MAERAPSIPNRGILTTLRAAALVIIATGLNDVLAGAIPRYEPLYLYLAVIALVTFLDGVLLGGMTAVTSIAFYALLFMRRADVMSPAMLLPASEAFATVVAAAIARGVLRMRTRRALPPQLFQPAPRVPMGVPLIGGDNTEVLEALGALRDEVRATREEALATARATELERSLRDRIGELERSLAAQHGNANAREVELRAANARVAELEARASDAAQRLDDAVHRAENAIQRAENEAQRADAREAELRETTGRMVELQIALQETRAAHADELHALRTRIAELEEAAAAQHALAAERESALLAAATRMAELDAIATESTQRADAREAELREAMDRVVELDLTLQETRTTGAEDAHALRTRLAQLQTALENASGDELEMDRLRARIAELEEDAAAQHSRLVDLEQTLAAERADFDQRLSTIVTHLAQDHEADLGKAVEEREEARAEARSLTMRVAALQKRVDEEKNTADETTRLIGDVRAAAQQEIDTLRARIAQLERGANPTVAPAASAPSRPRILIAHPDADLRKSAGASLERAGYEIVSAADGLEALRTAIAQRPAVVIADAIMPKMDGRELCQLLKSQEKTADIRVILLTRATDAPPKGDLMPDEVLRKPVPLETLKSTLAALLAS
ncbi:MAG: response regulator [Acidobacteriota bacterium]|nr:response regulator [Acidobacteriota bacterium]